MREERYLNSSDYLRRSYNLLKDKYARDVSLKNYCSMI